MIRILVLVLSVALTCLGHSGYRLDIPNGINVPNPCINVFGLWNAVGHTRQNGGGSLNLFGQDFLDANLTWTQELCMLDSDCDGQINGYELGDFNCTWFIGQPPLGDAQGHPGICEPMSDPKCMAINANITC